MKYSTKKLLAVLAVISIIAILFSSCGEELSDQQKFEEKRANIETVADSDVLTKTKELCKEALAKEGINVADIFIYVNYIDGYIFGAHVLTDKNEYLIYSIDSVCSGPLNTGLKYGTAGAYDDELWDHLGSTEPYVKESTIYFD